MKYYPTRGGLPVSPLELGYFGDITRDRSNNHHSAWPSKTMHRTLLGATFRDLSSMQQIMPIRRHNALHEVFQPPQLDMRAVYHYVVEAFERDEQLRLGTAFDPHYMKFTPERLTLIHAEVSQAA